MKRENDRRVKERAREMTDEESEIERDMRFGKAIERERDEKERKRKRENDMMKNEFFMQGSMERNTTATARQKGVKNNQK